MKSERWRGILLLVAIFVCGGIAGGAVVRLRTAATLRTLLREPAEGMEARMKLFMLETGLDLSAEQRERIRPILERSAAQARVVRQRVEPELAPIRKAERDAVGAILTSDQRAQYARKLAEIDKALGREP